MRRWVTVAALVVLTGAGGCRGVKTYLDDRLPPPARVATAPPAANDSVKLASAQEPPANAAPAGVDEFVRFAVERNPRIARAAIAIDAAHGRYIQAGLYPNPELGLFWDELGDRSSPDRLGVLTAPQITQRIITGKKLSLSQAIVAREIDQATLDLVGERYAVVGAVRAAFVDALAAQQLLALIGEQARLADESLAQAKILLEAKRIARLDLLEIEVEREKVHAEAEATARELPGLYRRLAAVAGDSSLAVGSVTGSFEGLPVYDLESARVAVLASHPEVRSARVAVDRAQAAVRRAEAEPIPNVTVYAAYIRQFENRSRDGGLGVALPLPLWDRNQGNIRTSRAELAMAIQNVARVENDLAARVAAAFQTYSSARERAGRYRREIVPRAEEGARLALEAFKGGQFDYLRVLQAQRAVAEARREMNRSFGEAWRSAAELSGLLLEEQWPGPVAPPDAPNPRPGPEEAPPPRPKRE